jgi:hypothetical protein
MGSPCYANNGFLGWHTAKLNQAKGNHLDAAREEAGIIESLPATRPLRLHVVGDCKDERSTRIVAKAAGAYRAKFGSARLDLHPRLERREAKCLGRYQRARVLRLAQPGTRGKPWRLCNGAGRRLVCTIQGLRP